MKSLKCFIACAFGKKDVDAFCDEVESLICNSKKIELIRIDKQLFLNENIDSKILKCIDSCNFMIADLTFSRPSVYFEVGYAIGIGKPVILTVRPDHFNGNTEPHKLHFDIRNRPIIPWDDNTKLVKLVSKVSKEIRLSHRKTETKRIEEYKFRLLSKSDIISSCQKRVLSYLTEKGYNSFHTIPSSGFLEFIDESKTTYLEVHLEINFTKSNLTSSIRYFFDRGRRNYKVLQQHVSNIDKRITVFVSCYKISEKTISQILPSYSKSVQGKIYHRKKPFVGVQFQHILFFIDDFKSFIEFDCRLEKID